MEKEESAFMKFGHLGSTTTRATYNSYPQWIEHSLLDWHLAKIYIHIFNSKK